MRVLIEICYWLLIALSPILVWTFVNVLIYSVYSFNIFIVIIECIGILAGVVLAEYIRKKYGCSTFYSKLMNTNDLGNQSNMKDKRWFLNLLTNKKLIGYEKINSGFAVHYFFFLLEKSSFRKARGCISVCRERWEL